MESSDSSDDKGSEGGFSEDSKKEVSEDPDDEGADEADSDTGDWLLFFLILTTTATLDSRMITITKMASEKSLTSKVSCNLGVKHRGDGGRIHSPQPGDID